MKSYIAAIAIFALVLSCDEGKNANHRILPNSSGNLNSLSVVLDNSVWEGQIGEEIRNIFAAPVDGLPQEEPLFSLRQMPTHVFSGFATNSRTILKIEKGKEAGLKVAEDAYARPQKMVVVSGMNNEEVIKQLRDNAPKIIATFKNADIKEKLRRIKKSLNTNNNIEKNLGLNITFPSVYRMAKDDDDFAWIRKDITTGTMDLMIYELPMGAIKRSDSVINDIIRMRDSIGKVHIPGAKEGSHMQTEKAFSPLLFETIVDNKPTLETKGTWDIKDGAFMGGPFINYIIEDKINNRLVVLEGYVFAPSVQKRDYMFELEAIIKSVKIK